MNDSRALLKVENLTKSFGNFKALDDISFDIKEGEVFSLVGESGSGKTTVGRLIISLYSLDSGDIYYRGERISSGVDSYRSELRALYDLNYPKNEKKKKIKELKEKISLSKKDNKNSEKLALKNEIQMIFQDASAALDPRMTVFEIISEGLVARGEKNKGVIAEKVDGILSLVGLSQDHRDRYPHELSGGQMQRVGIARCLMAEPRLLIADEPISALDTSVRAQILQLLCNLREKLGLTVLFIAHDLSAVKSFSDRIAVMYRGKIVELASCKELFDSPLHPYTKALLSAVLYPDPCSERNKKRLHYDRYTAHNYSEDKPSFREISNGHYVYCNSEEEALYKRELSDGRKE